PTTRWTGVLSDQPHPAEACLIECEHGLPNLAELELCVAPDHDPGSLFGAYGGAEGFAEMLAFDPLIVDPQLACVVDRDQYSASLVSLIGRLCSIRHTHLSSDPNQRNDDHKDDQQHEHDVDERRDVDGRLHLGRLTEPHAP